MSDVKKFDSLLILFLLVKELCTRRLIAVFDELGKTLNQFPLVGCCTQLSLLTEFFCAQGASSPFASTAARHGESAPFQRRELTT